MATLEKNALLTALDSSGNTVLLYPVTTVEGVDGLEELLSAKTSSYSLTLPKSGWTDNQQTVTVPAATAYATVICAGDDSSQPEYDMCQVWCSEQSAGSLTFSCTYQPTGDVVANVTIFT